MSDCKYDSYVGGDSIVGIDYHFCRQITEDGGCFGTDPDHGFTWEEAKKEVIKDLLMYIGFYDKYEQLDDLAGALAILAEWKAITEKEWQEKGNPSLV